MNKLTLRMKITIWYVLIFLILLSTFITYLYFFLSRTMYSNEESIVRLHVVQAVSAVDFEDTGISYFEPDGLITSGTYIYIYDPKNHLLKSSGPISGISNIIPQYDHPRDILIDKSRWLIYDQPIYNDKKLVAWIRGIRPLKPINQTLSNLIILSLFSIPIYLLITITGGLFIAGKALSPIDKITKAAREIGNGNLSKRLNLPALQDEVGLLALTFDEMLDKLETSFNRERQFTSDASHELRTPLTVISSYAEESLSGKRTLSELKENMKVILKESQGMAHMVSQLLLLTRSDDSNILIEIEDIDLSVIVNEISDEMRKLASKNNIELSTDIESNIKFRGDQALITMAIINLIENAIKYNNIGGKIKVSLSKTSDNARITVIDTGIGIAQQEIPYIFQRFYRVDKSRSRKGTGLGLSIVKWIIDAHQGSIFVDSVLAKGTKIIVDLPAK
ncbi:MAG: sensor histidine kinase [Bacillota bacterium]